MTKHIYFLLTVSFHLSGCATPNEIDSNLILFKPPRAELSSSATAIASSGNSGAEKEIINFLGANLSTFLFICPFENFTDYYFNLECNRNTYIKYIHQKMFSGESLLTVDNVVFLKNENGLQKYSFEVKKIIKGEFFTKTNPNGDINLLLKYVLNNMIYLVEVSEGNLVQIATGKAPEHKPWQEMEKVPGKRGKGSDRNGTNLRGF